MTETGTISPSRLDEIISGGETLQVEFKSDRRQINDKIIYEEIVALANAEGGYLLIGVEDDGQVTGAKPRHGPTTEPNKLQSAIFNNTVPSIPAQASLVHHTRGDVLVFQVPHCPEPCSTASGKSLRRIIGPDGKPQSVPYYPRDQRSRRIDLGLLDFSAQTLEGLSFGDLDPLEFERLRQTIVRLHGDEHLLSLSDEDLAKALRLVETRQGKSVPNVAGMLLLGRKTALIKHLPTHAVHFQVLDAQQNVKMNDVFHGPLLGILDAVEERFVARNSEQEVAIGMIRLPVPDYAPQSFREAVNNALLHRDYSFLQGSYIQWQPDHLLINNPGGFLPGISLDNLLVHEPKPRNPRLAEAFRRIGLVEQTGRGIDKIYLGQLRYGRPLPDYSRSSTDAVRVVLLGGPASLSFAAFVFEQERDKTPLTLNELMVLNTLFSERRIDSQRTSRLIQGSLTQARAILGMLTERGLLEATGKGKGREYVMSAGLYRRLGKSEAYVRAHGISPIRHEAMILDYIQAHGSVERKHVIRLCSLTSQQAGRLLKKMMTDGKIIRKGTPPRWTFYVLPGR